MLQTTNSTVPKRVLRYGAKLPRSLKQNWLLNSNTMQQNQCARVWPRRLWRSTPRAADLKQLRLVPDKKKEKSGSERYRLLCEKGRPKVVSAECFREFEHIRSR